MNLIEANNNSFLEPNSPPLNNNKEKSASQNQAETVSRLQKIKSSIHQKKIHLADSNPLQNEIKPHTVKEVIVPIREREAARAIHNKAANTIAQVHQETEKALKHLIGDPDGDITLFLLQKRDEKIQEIKEEALCEIERLSKPTNKPTASTEKENIEDQKIDELLHSYTTKLAAIEQKELEAVRKIENDPKVTLRVKRESSLRIEIEKEREQKIARVRQESLDQKNLLFLQATYECRPYQKDFFIKVLRGYDQKLASKERIFTTHHLEEIARDIESSFAREKDALTETSSWINNKSITSKELSKAVETIEREDQIRLSLLQPCVKASTTQNLEMLSIIEQELIHPEFLESNKLGDSEKTVELSKLLKKIRTDYFVAEAISTDLAQQVAEEAISHLGKEIESLKRRLEESAKEIALFEKSNTRIPPVNNPGIDSTIYFYQKLQDYLEEAQQAYKQIALDCSLRVKDILEFKDHVVIFKEASILLRQESQRAPFDLEKSFSQQQVVSTNNALIRNASLRAPLDLETTNSALQRQLSQRLHSQRLQRMTSLRKNSSRTLTSSLATLEEETQEEEENDQPLGIDFLEKLEEVPPEKDSYFLMGKRGEIELLPSLQVDQKSKGAEGLHFTRLAIFRDYGAQGLAHFDEYFQEKVRLGSPITLAELITFIDGENQKNQSAFYLSSARSLKELIVGAPNEQGDKKSIKIESTSFSFSPTHTLKRTGLDKNENKKELFTAIQEEVKKFFGNLPSSKLEETLERFAKWFEDTEEQEGMPLTVGNLRSFLIKEIEKHQSDFANIDIISLLFDQLSPHMETIYGGLINALGLSSGAMMVFGAAKSLLSYLGAFRYAFRYIRNMLPR